MVRGAPGRRPEVAVGQPIAQRARLVVAEVLVELRDVIDDAAATAGDVGGRAIGAGKGWDSLRGNTFGNGRVRQLQRAIDSLSITEQLAKETIMWQSITLGE